MKKLTREQKIEVYEKRKQGMTIQELSSCYGLRKEGIKYLIRLIDQHGYQILRDGHSRSYPAALKEAAVREVLEKGESIGRTAIKYGLSSKTALTNWIRQYRGCYSVGNTLDDRYSGSPLMFCHTNGTMT